MELPDLRDKVDRLDTWVGAHPTTTVQFTGSVLLLTMSGNLALSANRLIETMNYISAHPDVDPLLFNLVIASTVRLELATAIMGVVGSLALLWLNKTIHKDSKNTELPIAK